MESNTGKNPFNDDFAAIFDDADMDIDNLEGSQAMSELIISFIAALSLLLEDEISVQKKLETVQHLTKFLPKISFCHLEEKLLRHLILAIKDILSNIFNQIHESLALAGMQKSKDLLNVLQDYLQMCIAIHEALDYILEYIIRNKDFDLFAMQSVPLNVADVLLLTFQHCKESDKIYKVYFDDLKEILGLFKISQDVHIKLLKLLELTNSELQSNEQLVLLKNVLAAIGRIGEVLIDMNIKAWADTWKGYMATTQKFSGPLNNSGFDISQNIEFLSVEIAKNVKTVLEMKFVDHKGAIQTLKICNFSVRVICKLCDTFWPTLQAAHTSIALFFITIYKFYVPLLQCKGYNKIIVDHVQSLIFDCSDILLKRLIEESYFLQSFSNIKTEQAGINYLFFVMIIFQTIVKTERPIKLSGVKSLIESYFKIFNTCYHELFWKLQIVNDQDADIKNLYDMSVTNVSMIVLLLDAIEYADIQKTLLINILQEHTWSALLAIDVWCLVLKKQPSRFCFKTLCHILYCTEPLLLYNFSGRPEATYLEHFLQRLCINMPEEYKIMLANKYPLATKLHVWKALGITSFPKSQALALESLINNTIKKIDRFQLGQFNSADFSEMCLSFEIIANLSKEELSNLSLQQLLIAIMKLWNFNVDGSFCGNNLFKHFISKLCLITSNLMVYIENKQLLMVLQNLKQMLLAGYNLELQVSQVLLTLSNKIISLTPEESPIVEVLADILNINLQGKNPIIEWYMIEICTEFSKVTPHKMALHSIFKHKPQFQCAVSNFALRKAVAVKIDVDSYFVRQGAYQFRHRCPDLQLKSDKGSSNERRHKRPALAEEIDSVMKRIKSDVGLLHTLCGKEDMLERSITEIVDILKRQIGY